MFRTTLIAAIVTVVATTAPASADVMISSAPTHNMACSDGVCAPMGGHPVLNVKDLETLLAAGDVEVTTIGHRGDARNIDVRNRFHWSASSTLTLAASQLLQIDQSIAVRGSGGVVLTQVPFFIGKGKITFVNLSSSLSVRGIAFTLVDSLQGLATAIAANPQGSFALARTYDASGDGTYAASPIPTNFLGTLEGLGNTISNISVNNTSTCCVGGLFQSISSSAKIFNVHLANVSVVSVQGAAGLAYESFGYIRESSVTGSVTGGSTADIGGLISDNYGSIEYSYSTAAVSAGATVSGVNVGGLVAADLGVTTGSFATGNVSAGDGSGSIGGLVGDDNARGDSPENSYATGNVSGGAGLYVGGLIGTSDYNNGYHSTSFCYSTGAVSGGMGSTVGGLIGLNNSVLEDDYWDTTTSGTDVGIGLGNASGVTGLTTEQLQSGLPAGFDPSTWRQSPNVNNGFPYLIYNPRPK